jgi:G protein-coupled receptor 157
MRSGVREVITYLALADLLTAGGYIIASINYLVYYAENAGQVGVISSESSCVAFDSICQIQAYITSWSSYSSFWWTIILSLYLFGTIVVGNMKQVNRLFPLYHVIAWGTPIIPMFPLLATHSLGYSLFAAAGWCFIRGDRNISPTYSLNAGTVAKILVGGKALEIFTYLWVVIIYIVIKFDIRKKKKAQLMYRYTVTGPVNDNLLKQVEWKLSFIPLLFVAVRIWGTLHFLFSIVVFNASSLMDNNGCISPYVKNIFEALIILQVRLNNKQYYHYTLISIGCWRWWTRMGQCYIVHIDVTKNIKSFVCKATAMVL